MDIRFVEYDKTFLNYSLHWLSDPEIKHLTMTPDIDRKSQLTWFENLKNRTDYLIWGITANGIPIGAAGIKHIDHVQRTGEYWTYIGEKEFIGKGIGKQIVSQIMVEAERIGLSQLMMYVAEYNERSYQLHFKCGFQETERNNGVITMQLNIPTKIV